ncbi:MAG: DUF4202 domain-containing protein [Alphaproteobacteria bacterium]
MTADRLDQVLRLIDEANAHDPTVVEVDGAPVPAELVYGRRMSAVLAEFQPAAGEILRIAARGQHLERWTSPRQSYPPGRIGYLTWRKDLKDYHARRVGDLMAAAGYGKSDIERAGQLLRKERLSLDSEVQTIEDVACLVFLKYYAERFIAPHDDAKVIDILAKTARKMSKNGIAAAGQLALAERLSRLLLTALASRGPAASPHA